MLYFLLIVIAVGVLLISPAGKKILKWVAIIGGIGALIFGTGFVILLVWFEYSQVLAIILGLAVLAGVIKIFGLDK